MDVAEARRALRKIVVSLERLDAQMRRLAASIPTYPAQEAMYESERPYDVLTEIQATVEYSRVEHVQAGVTLLRAAASATEADLRQRFDRMQGGGDGTAAAARAVGDDQRGGDPS